MRFLSVVFFLLASNAQASEEATFVGLVDFRHGPDSPVDVVGVTNVGINDDDAHGHNGGAADGSKGTHYGDPAEGCMKDEVRVYKNACCICMTLFGFDSRHGRHLLTCPT